MKCVDCKFFEPYAERGDGTGWCRVYDAMRYVDSKYKCGKPAKEEHEESEVTK